MNRTQHKLSLKTVGYPIIFLVIIFGMPVLLSIAAKYPIFSFAPGEVGTWITFWGSYFGAIIGASAVYFVARYQINKQHEQQIKAIEIENIQSTKREMKQFYLKNKLVKIEEMQKILTKIEGITLNLNNDLLEFVIHSESIGMDYKSKRNVDPVESIYKLRKRLRNLHLEIVSEMSSLAVLSKYIKRMEKEYLFLQQKIFELHQEIKECYYKDEAYKKYLFGPPDELFLLENAEIIMRTINYLRVDYLNYELKSTLDEIERFAK